MGAGIIPVAIHNGKVYLLFGKEVQDGKWSDFGGGREHNETPFKTAIREGCEELSGFLGCKTKLAKDVKTNLILALRVKTYTTYIFQTAYDANLPEYYRNHFLFVKSKFPHLINTDGNFEKSEIAWLSLEELKKKRLSFRPFYREVVDAIIENKEILQS